MREYTKTWYRPGRKTQFTIRWWFRNPFRSIWRWLMDDGAKPMWGEDLPQINLLTQHNGWCYCQPGLNTVFRLQAFGVGCWGWFQRGQDVSPCACQKSLWITFPDDYAADIEDHGGLEKLQADMKSAS